MKTLNWSYVIFGTVICLWLTTSAIKGWRAPQWGILNQAGGLGRGSGGFWGGGK